MVDFSKIRILDGAQSKGFEELCVQLFPALIGEKLEQIDRVEGHGGDGGVEAIAMTISGNRFGLQAKFFYKLDTSQWKQIDNSVITAIKNHPFLARYIICSPLNRTPAQIKKWENKKANWEKIQSTLQVEWIGESELRSYLLKEENSYLLTYWFSRPEFSLGWVSKQTNIAIEQLHARYTPKLHQTTSTEVTLNLLIASEKICKKYLENCSKLIISWRKVLREIPALIKKQKPSISSAELEKAYHRMLFELKEGILTEQSEELINALNSLKMESRTLAENLFPQEITDNYFDRKLINQFYQNSHMYEAFDLMEDIEKEILQFTDAQQQSIWILTGEAGSGKSHLFANLARTMQSEGRACLLVIGERFATQDVLSEQIRKLVGWDWTMRELLECFSAQAALTGKSTLLMVDAINESPQRGLWKRELTQLANLIKEFTGVKLLVSCRSDCLKSNIPGFILEKIEPIQHNGFDLQFHESVQAYFDGYKVTSQQFPTLNPEFKNPLFLKTLCEAYQGKQLPLGAISFVSVLTAWENRIAEEIEKKIDCPSSDTKEAITEIIQKLATSNAKRVNANVVKKICKAHFPIPEASRSLYHHLNSEGLLQEIETREETYVRLQYERFSDVRIAQIILKGITSKNAWLAHWKNNILPSFFEQDYFDLSNSPKLFALALLLPDICLELLECPIAFFVREPLEYFHIKDSLLEAWLDALAWRVLDSNNIKIVRYFKLWANKQKNDYIVFRRLFQFACIPENPLNADFLHNVLIRMSLSKRELHWAIPLAHEDVTDQSGDGFIAPFFYWANASAGKASTEQTRLTAIVLLWLTSSTNRALRDKATDIAIRILAANRSLGICLQLLKSFWNVDDPYVKERLLAVMCGVLPYLAQKDVRTISEWILKNFWQQSDIPPHILQREYAAFIIRHACEIGALDSVCLSILERGIHKEKPIVWSEEQVKVYEENSYEYGTITSSLKIEVMGGYGDFGRYEMGFMVDFFKDDEQFARRYIWQCIIRLGWKPELYNKFENNLRYYGRSTPKVERISKKYQWIGLYEYLGHLSDALLVRNWNDDTHPLRGAWELSARNYNPSLAIIDKNSKDGDIEYILPSGVKKSSSVKYKQEWVKSEFESFIPFLTMQDEKNQWIFLKNHHSFREEPQFGSERFKSAEMSQWIDIRVFLVPKSELSETLEILRGKDFW